MDLKFYLKGDGWTQPRRASVMRNGKQCLADDRFVFGRTLFTVTASGAISTPRDVIKAFEAMGYDDRSLLLRQLPQLHLDLVQKDMQPTLLLPKN